MKHVSTYYTCSSCRGVSFRANVTNGEKAELDSRDRIVGRGGVFTPLEDIEFFKRVRVDPEIGTLVWPNDVDFCPDVLYSEATGQPLLEFEMA